jgi:hypothetical protein
MCARIDIRKFKDADGLELGDSVEIVLKGKVKSLRGPEEGVHSSPDGKMKKADIYNYPGSVEIELESFKLLETGEYEGMLDDE